MEIERDRLQWWPPPNRRFVGKQKGVKVTTQSSQAQVPTVARPATTKPPVPATWVLKVIMALTGLVLFGFVVVHMVGNLKIFLGEEALNHYAEWLQQDLLYPLVPQGWFIWIFRGFMTICLVAHIYSAIVIRRRAGKARGSFKRKGLKGLGNFQARNMLVTGVVLFLFLVFHLLDLTIGKGVASPEFEHMSAYDNVIASFSRPAVAIFYIVAMVILFLHLAHGLWSTVNDLGATGHRVRATVWALAGIVALLIMAGNIAIPLAVMTGVVA